MLMADSNVFCPLRFYVFRKWRILIMKIGLSPSSEKEVNEMTVAAHLYRVLKFDVTNI